MYYKLIYRSSLLKKQVGDVVFCGLKPLDIGQSPSCDVYIPGSPELEPEVLASVLPDPDGKGWIIIRRTDRYDVRVNGNVLQVCRPLASGDSITTGTEAGKVRLEFVVCHDGEYDAGKGLVYRQRLPNRRIQYVTAVTALLAVVLAVLAVFSGRGKNPLRQENLDVYDRSIYRITVDSVYLVHDTVIDGREVREVLEANVPEMQPSGTCFLTDEGIFVTARHCVEPWITDEKWDGTGFYTKMPAAVRLAAEAETRNRMQGTKDYSVKARCIISNGLETFYLYSDDFHYNKTRDKVLRLGTDRQPIYWRTIMPLANRRDMELGDFAYIEAGGGITGSLELATLDDMKVFDKQVDKEIAVIGFPVNDNSNASLCVKVYGNSQHVEFTEDGQSIGGCIQMSAAVNPGNSGGPVVARIGGKVKVVGIVSKADGLATQGVFWAVPVTEVAYLRSHGGAINDSITYRR